MAERAYLSDPDPEFAELWTKVQGFYPTPGTITVASQRHAMASIVIPGVMATLQPSLPPGAHSYRVSTSTAN
jgi:hypothetical protein